MLECDWSEASWCQLQIGTTVTIHNLFRALPVRHKEFLRNLKREFAKMLQLLSAYALVSTRTKFTCTNQNAKGYFLRALQLNASMFFSDFFLNSRKRQTVLFTNNNESMRENISNIFGAKQVRELVFIIIFSNDVTNLHPSCSCRRSRSTASQTQSCARSST